MKQFRKGDCFRIPWDKHLGETFFMVTEVRQDKDGRQVLLAKDTLNDDLVISTYNTEVAPI
jgi:hypothetical protein